MSFKVYIFILFITIGIIWFVNAFRITKIALKLRNSSASEEAERQKIRKYKLYIILSFIVFFIVVFFSYLVKFG